MLKMRLLAKKIGHPSAQNNNIRPVPTSLCKRGKATSSHTACEIPERAVAAAISSGEKPAPPSSICVYKNTGLTAVYVKARHMT